MDNFVTISAFPSSEKPLPVRTRLHGTTKHQRLTANDKLASDE